MKEKVNKVWGIVSTEAKIKSKKDFEVTEEALNVYASKGLKDNNLHDRPTSSISVVISLYMYSDVHT